MKFLLDESAEVKITAFLESLGHDVEIVTGVIYFRFPLDSTANQKIASPERLLVSHQDRLDQFLVVSPRGVRVRRS